MAESRASRRSSAVRWSVAHPNLEHAEDAIPRRFRLPRFLTRRRRTSPDAVSVLDDQVVFVNDTTKNERFAPNLFITSKYTILTFFPKNMSEQFRRVANSYFLFITAIQFVPGVSPFPIIITLGPLLLLLGIVALKEAFEDFYRHLADMKVNSAPVERITAEGPVEVAKSKVIRVGEIVAVNRDEVCAADIVVLATEHESSLFWVDTAALDGETRLKPRRSVNLNEFIPEVGENEQPSRDQLSKLRAIISSDPPNPFLEVFSGRMDSVDPESNSAVQLSRENLMLRGAVLRNCRRVWGCVVGAGKTTKLSLNQKLPAFKRSRLEKQLNAALGIVFLVQAILSGVFAGLQVTNAMDFKELGWDIGMAWGLSYLTWFILMSFMVPMTLYVVLEFGKLFGGLYLFWDKEMRSRDGLKRPAKPNTTSLMEELGSIEFILSDKTGTLTENEMKFSHCGTMKGLYTFSPASRSLQKLTRANRPGPTALGPGRASSSDRDLNTLMLIMAGCNELEIEIEDDEVLYSGESPDEIALADTAKVFGTELKDRTKKTMTINTTQYKIHALLPFSSARKRMAIAVSEPSKPGKAQIWYKGADNVMFELFDQDVGELDDKVLQLSQLGLRTLVMGSAEIDMDSNLWAKFMEMYDDAQIALEDREEKIQAVFELLEGHLQPLGCTGVEDKLSEGVENALQSLITAKIQVAVLTGDKTETAISICRMCGLFKPGTLFHELTEPDEEFVRSFFKCILPKSGTIVDIDVDMEAQSEEALILSGECLRICLKERDLEESLVELLLRCYTTVCTRMTPKQKAVVTSLVRKHFGKVVLAIGDGANDVSMLREAEVGVGVYGKEGSQAVNAADFCIHRFADLKRLLFVHGATSRHRIVIAARASLFVNMAFNSPQVLFGFASSFSGQSIELANILLVINILITSPFLACIILFDRQLLPEDLENNPEFYDPRTVNFTIKDFVFEMALAWYHGVVAIGAGFLFGEIWREDGQVAGLWLQGTMVTLVVVHGMIGSLLLRFDAFTWFHRLLPFCGLFVLWFVAIIHPSTSDDPTIDNAFALSYISGGPFFWAVFILGVVTSLIPDFLFLKAIPQIYFPNPMQIFLEQRKIEDKFL